MTFLIKLYRCSAFNSNLILDLIAPNLRNTDQTSIDYIPQPISRIEQLGRSLIYQNLKSSQSLKVTPYVRELLVDINQIIIEIVHRHQFHLEGLSQGGVAGPGVWLLGYSFGRVEPSDLLLSFGRFESWESRWGGFSRG